MLFSKIDQKWDFFSLECFFLNWRFCKNFFVDHLEDLTLLKSKKAKRIKSLFEKSGCDL